MTAIAATMKPVCMTGESGYVCRDFLDAWSIPFYAIPIQYMPLRSLPFVDF